MFGKLRISAVMEGFSIPKSFKCFFRSFSTRGNFWGKLFRPFLIHVMPRKWSKLKILNIGTKYESKSQIAGTRMCLPAVHVEACVILRACTCALAFESPCFALDAFQLCRFEVISLWTLSSLLHQNTHTQTETAFILNEAELD